MHATTGVPRRSLAARFLRGPDGVLVRAAPGDPEPHMPNTAEIEPRMAFQRRGARTKATRRLSFPLLEQLAYNLRWSWDPATARAVPSLAPEPWSRTHNPIAVLVRRHDPDRLAEHAESILERHAELEQYLTGSRASSGMPRIAYFCAEFAIAESLPIYSGGLGVLAGDHLKAASDLGLPLVAVGLLYRYGYFRQVIDEAATSTKPTIASTRTRSPSVRCWTPAAQPVVVDVPFPGRTRATPACGCPGWPRAALFARYRPGRKPRGRSLDHRPPLRRRPGHPHPPGDRARHRRLAGAARRAAGRRAAGGHAHERGPSGLPEPRAGARSARFGRGQHVRRGRAAGRAASGVHHPHTGRRRPRRVPVATWSRRTSTATASSSA